MSKIGGILDPDTPVPKETYEIARLSSGGAIEAGRLVCEKIVDASFALIRPPGHHAGKDFGGGFCYLNNTAIQIRYLQANKKVKKVAILDWDAHHGNGTQDIFYDDDSVLYFSTHQFPFYPFTGDFNEIGKDKGKGFNVNVPLDVGTSGKDFEYIVKEIFIPIVKEFKPDLITVSAGYDAYFLDPLTSLNFSVTTYANVTKLLKETAKKICGGKVSFILEGGYHLIGLSHSVLATVLTLLDSKRIKEPYLPPEQKISREIKERVKKLKKILNEYWNVF